jgi:hypothetical protein
VRVLGLLLPRAVYPLVKIALFIQQADAYNEQPQVRWLIAVISRQQAQTPE